MVKVYVVTHKEVSKIDKYIDSSYTKIMVGDRGLNPPENYLSDRFNGGISEKNKNFSELTAHYYIWKKSDDPIVGMIHYRRILSDSFLPILRYRALSGEKIQKILKNYDVIIPKKFKLDTSLREHYAENHFSKDYDILETLIKKDYPKYYDEFTKYSNGRYLYSANVLITKKEIFDKYSKWLFEILFKLEKMIDISSYDDYQKRIFGFISERLLYVWFKTNNYKIKNVNLIHLEINQIKVTLFPLYKKIFRRRKR